MEQSVSDATPIVLLSSYDALHISILVPRAFARNHDNLVRTAQHRFGKHYPDSDFEVHFHRSLKHIKSNRCDAQIDDYLYDMGAYFTEEHLQQGVLCLVAHFVERSRTPAQQQNLVSEQAQPAKVQGAGLMVDLHNLPRLDYRRARNFRGRCPPAPRRSTLTRVDSPSVELQPILKVDDSPIPSPNQNVTSVYHGTTAGRQGDQEVKSHGLPLVDDSPGTQQIQASMGAHYRPAESHQDNEEAQFHGLPLVDNTSPERPTGIEPEAIDRVRYPLNSPSHEGRDFASILVPYLEHEPTSETTLNAKVDTSTITQPRVPSAQSVVHIFSSPEPSHDETEEYEWLSDRSQRFSDVSDHSMEDSDYSPESDGSQEESDYCSEESEDFSEVVDYSPENKEPSFERSDVDDESWFTQFMSDLQLFSETQDPDCTSTDSAPQSPEFISQEQATTLRCLQRPPQRNILKT